MTKSAWTLLALALSAFAIGATEFISVGVLPMLMQAFDIQLATAGLTTTLYALGITIGAPSLTLVTGHIARKRLLLFTMITFIVGNLVTAFAPTFTILLIGRVIAAMAHGVFMTIASIIASEVVTADKRASAIAMMFTGLTVATVAGVPLGTFIAQHVIWRGAFIFVAMIGLIALLADWYLVPANLPQPAPLKTGSIRRLFQVPSLRANMVLTALAFGASFPIYTYLSAILKNQHWSDMMSVYILIGYGLMVAIGNTIGGRLANSQPLQALQRVLWVELGVLIIVSLTITQHWFGLIALLGLGLFGFMGVPALQLQMLQTAERELPADINMASALNVASFNVGITVGSLSGGYLVSAFGVPSTPIASLIIISLALLLIWRMKKS